MADLKLVHPNFRIRRDLGRVLNRWRAMMFTTTQPTYDAILSEIDHGRAKSTNDVLARAIEKHLELQPGSASLKPSDSS